MTVQEFINDYNYMVAGQEEEIDQETMEELLPMIYNMLKINVEAEEYPEIEFINKKGQIGIKNV